VGAPEPERTQRALERVCPSRRVRPPAACSRIGLAGWRPGPDHNGGTQFIIGDDSRPEASASYRGRGDRSLPLAGLDQKVTVRGKPLRGSGGDPALDLRPVRAAIKRDQRLVQARLCRKKRDLTSRHVGRIG
jgi:hypothetical protein